MGLVLGAAPSAGAATVSAQWEPFGTPVGSVQVDAAAGERNQLVVTLTDAIRVADSVPLDAGAGCRKEPDGRVACDPPAPGVLYADVDAGDQDDTVRFDIGSEVMQISVDGGDGGDLLVGGGRGTNFFTGGNGEDRMVGGAGGNEFLEGTSPNGSDRFEGGHGLYDSVRYDARRHGLRVRLDGEANDGEPGEHDFISPSVTSVFGGGGADVLVGGERSDGLVGAGGADVIRGGAGNDQLVGGHRLYGRVGSDDRLYGGAGSDRLAGNAGDDLLVGGPGRDRLDAFGGADLLLPGGGRDTVRAGPGDDRIDARDHTADALGCGRGEDTARNDRIDWLSRACEHHDRGRSLESRSAFHSLTGMPAARIRSFASRTL
jgi:Ca2+-binding RTX toxin-like protein